MKPFHEFIWTIRDTARELHRIEEQLKETRQIAYSLRGVSYDGVGGGGQKKANVWLFTRVIQLEEYYVEKRTQMYQQQLELEQFCDTLEPLDRDVLKAYYVDRLTQEKAAERLGYSTRRYQSLQGEAYERAKQKYERAISGGPV